MYTVIIVDDYEVFRRALRSMPVWGEALGFVIREEASDGRQALMKLRDNPVDLLLTDIRMPVVDGLELIAEASGRSLCGCAVIMSQFSDFEYARKGLSTGALEHLLKPVDQAELMKCLKRAAVHINEKNMTASRITYLESMLNNDSGEFFPDEELDRLAYLIGEGSDDASTAAAYLADVTFAGLDSDCLKTAGALTRAFSKLLETIKADFPWIGKFLTPDELILDDYSNHGDIAALRECFVEKAALLVSTIRKYELDIENDSIVRTACKTILENIDANITISDLAGKLFITRTYLSQLFKEKTGTTLVRYLTDVRIERAKVLIACGCKNYEIAEKLGYKDDEYFKKLFKDKTGMTINEYKSKCADA